MYYRLFLYRVSVVVMNEENKDYVLNLSQDEKDMLVVAVGSFAQFIGPSLNDDGTKLMVDLLGKVFYTLEGISAPDEDIAELIKTTSPLAGIPSPAPEPSPNKSKDKKVRPLHFGW